MLYIAFWFAFYDVIICVVLARTAQTFIKCVQLGTTSVNKTPFVNWECISAVYGAQMCTEVTECTVFTYDDLTKTCRLYKMIETINCNLNEKNGGLIFTKEAVCPVDWQKFGNSCYFYENTKRMSWDDAKEYCISQGGYLAEVTDEAEIQLVDSIINDDVFLGCRLYDGNWQWTTSGQKLLLHDPLWALGEPKTEECVQIWAGKFDDTSCGNPKKFVCEKAILFI